MRHRTGFRQLRREVCRNLRDNQRPVLDGSDPSNDQEQHQHDPRHRVTGVAELARGGRRALLVRDWLAGQTLHPGAGSIGQAGGGTRLCHIHVNNDTARP
jgi:hypothetical protein